MLKAVAPLSRCLHGQSSLAADQHKTKTYREHTLSEAARLVWRSYLTLGEEGTAFCDQ
jgi:hypothetical protein